MRCMFRMSQKPHRFAPAAVTALFTIATGGAWVPSAQAADSPIVQYDLQGSPGTQTTNTPSFAATGVSGISLTEGSGLIPALGSNAMNSSGWDDLGANDFYSLGFNVLAGNTVTVDSLTLATRSGTDGPGFINVLASVDGGPETLLTTITQSGTAFADNILIFPPVSATSSLTIFLRAANKTSASGGTTLSSGTFRIGDYDPSGPPTPVTISGTIAPTATPEPGSLAFLLSALGTAGIVARKRRTN